MTEKVVLLHGLGRSPASMLPLDWRLSRRGWDVIRIGYDSTRQSIVDSIAEVRVALPIGSIRIVGHSLGGVIASKLLREGPSLDIQSIVQLGSPNLGTPVAERMTGFGLARWACGPALEEIAALSEDPPADRRIGAVAGTAGVGLPGTGLDRPHDGAVSVASAHAGAGHCATVPVLHTLLPASSIVADLTARFLAEGRFPEDG